MATKKKTTKAKTAKGKTAAGTKLPSSSTVAELLGVTLTKRLTPSQIHKLLKPLPGYVSLLDDVARKLEGDAHLLNLRDVTPEALMQTHAAQKDLAAREAVVEIVFRSIYEQRMQVDSRGMDMLLKISRRVDALTEEDPELPVRWKFLQDFLREFRTGGRKPAPPTSTTPPAAASG